MSGERMKIIGYYVSKKPDDYCYRVRALHKGEELPEHYYWDGVFYDEALDMMRKANKEAKEAREASCDKPVYVIINIDKNWGCYRIDKHMVKPGATLEKQEHEEYRFNSYREAQGKMKELNQKRKTEERELKMKRKIDEMIARVNLMCKEPWQPKVNLK